MISAVEIAKFQQLIWQFAQANHRDMPWRLPALALQKDNSLDPYAILVSEIMLQQTQVERVKPKFISFMRQFPSVSALAAAKLSEVLVAWSGLGYNRRAKFLWQAAQKIETDFNGVFPRTQSELVTLAGVGPNTAGAILAYAFNQPNVFIETNIRSVYLHHFFNGGEKASDKQLAELVSRTLDVEHPREWYWALMDYGTHLKKNGAGYISQSAHYKKQTPLKGSLREMRGRIIKALAHSHLDEATLEAQVSADERYQPALQALLHEQLVKRHEGKISLA